MRFLRGLISYLSVILIAAILLQVFTPIPMLRWIGQLAEVIAGYFRSN